MSPEEYVSSSALSDFVSRVEKITEKYPQMNEDNTKSKIIRDFIELLGWDIAFDAELEYRVDLGHTKNYVDYSLSLGDSSPVLLIEAKGYDTTLDDSNEDQLHSYLRQTDVNWGLLTNGKEYRIYRRESVDDGVEIRTVAELKLEDLPARKDYVSLLSKEALQSGRSGEFAQRIFEIRNARDQLERDKDTIAARIAEVFTDSVGDVISQRAETEAKETVDRLIRELEERTEQLGQRREHEGDGEEVGEDGPSVVGADDADEFWADVERETGIRKTGESVELTEEGPATADYVNFIQFLFENGYLSRDDLPIESGRTRYILNTDNRHRNGTEMYNPKEVVDGVFLETHQNTDDKRRRIQQLGEQFGTSE